MKTRKVVATVLVAATEAKGLNLTLDTNDPLVALAVKALKMSVPIVPAPSDLVLAALGTTDVMIGVRTKIGEVFCAMRLLEG